jgi:hypothetical protein
MTSFASKRRSVPRRRSSVIIGIKVNNHQNKVSSKCKEVSDKKEKISDS